MHKYITLVFNRDAEKLTCDNVKKIVHHCLLLVFFLTAIGQFTYACEAMDETASASTVCCCDGAMLELDDICPMENMSAPADMSAPESCCEVHYQVTGSDGSPVDSPPPQLLKQLTLDFGDLPVTAFNTYDILFNSRQTLAYAAPATRFLSPSSQPIFLLTQRLRI